MDKKEISLKSIMSGMGLALLCPAVIIAVFFLFFGNYNIGSLWNTWRGQIEIVLVFFLAGVGLTQLIYIIPLIVFFRRRNKPGWVRGLLIGAVVVIVLNIIDLYWFHMKWEKAVAGSTTGNLGRIKSGAAVYYGDAPGAWPAKIRSSEELIQKKRTVNIPVPEFIYGKWVIYKSAQAGESTSFGSLELAEKSMGQTIELGKDYVYSPIDTFIWSRGHHAVKKYSCLIRTYNFKGPYIYQDEYDKGSIEGSGLEGAYEKISKVLMIEDQYFSITKDNELVTRGEGTFVFMKKVK